MKIDADQEPSDFDTADDRREQTQQQREDAYLKVIHQLMTRLQLTTINLPGATTELGPRATVKRGEQFYHVNAGDERGGR